MRDLAIVTQQVVGWLDANHVRYALIGGLAVSFRAIERLTKDIDLAIVVADDRQAENVVHELCSLGFQIDLLLEQKQKDRIATVRLIKKSAKSVFVDLLFSSSGIEAEVAGDAEPIEVFPNVVVNTAQLHSLLALKVLSADPKSRPQDELDIKNLLAMANSQDLKAAEILVRLIEERGFQRGKDLQKLFLEYRARFL
jgi:Nucleotidyl transferase AbiEii toxin, Type IV TA system